MSKNLPRTIGEYKKAVRRAIASTVEVRKYGDLRKKATWEAAYADFCTPRREASPLTGETSPLTGETSPLTGETSPLTGETSPLTESTVKFELSDRERELLFGQPVHKVNKDGQLLLLEFEDFEEPPDPDDYPNDYEWHYYLWALHFPEIAAASQKWASMVWDLPQPKETSKSAKTIIYPSLLQSSKSRENEDTRAKYKQPKPKHQLDHFYWEVAQTDG